MSDSLRDDVLKAARNAECKNKVVIIGEGRPSKSWLEIYTENIEKETARKIFADIRDLHPTWSLDSFCKYCELKKKYKVED